MSMKNHKAGVPPHHIKNTTAQHSPFKNLTNTINNQVKPNHTASKDLDAYLR